MTEAIVIRPLLDTDADATALWRMRCANRHYFQPTEPLRDDAFFTLEHQRSVIRGDGEAAERGEAMSFGIFLGDALVGRVALTSIVRGPFLNAYLGYQVDRRFTNRGIATTAVHQAVRHGWDQGLHRVQAAVSPDNAPSLRVLGKLGFRREGLALRYLKLAGRWADQELWAITTEDRLRPASGDPGTLAKGQRIG